MLKELQNILLHIRQSTISATEVPYLNYVYAGSYNDIMKMYYGIISELFQIGYQMGHDEKICQYNITFCVDFESTTKIYSDMYMLSDPTIMERFVIFHLPFDAFTDIESTVKFLAHEIFHYIAPFSRKERNKKLTLIWSKKLIQGLVEGLIDHYDFSEEIQSSLEKEYCREEDEHMKPLFDNIYLCMKGLMENDSIDFDRIIINGFMKGTPYVWHFYEAYNKIIEMVLGDIFSKYPLVVKKICEKHRLSSLEGKVEDLAYREVSKKLNSKEDFHYAIKMLNDIANSYREAFCDLNAAFLFEMNAEDYLNFFYNLKIKSTVTSLKEQKFMQQLSQSQNRGAALDALGERLGMVLDELCGIGSNKNELNDFLPKESDLEKDDCFQQLKNYIDKIYDQFQNTERLFRKRYANLFGEIDYFWKEENPEEVQKIKRKFCEIKGCKDDLEKCLRIVNYFANRDIKFKQTKLYNAAKITYQSSQLMFVSHSYDRAIANVGDFIEKVCQISEDMVKNSGENRQPCWYRGVCDSNFSLLPSLYRKYYKKPKKKIRRSLYSYQTKILQDAYYLTMKMPALWTDQLHGIAEHTCCLQHYGMPTTLLDFSLDMLVALHFALNPDEPTDRANIDSAKSRPKVIIFNPVLYNKAILSLREGKIADETSYVQCSPVMFDARDKSMQDYFVYDMSAEHSMQTTKIFMEKSYVSDPRINLYPKPVIIQQTNSRVLAQNGIFMAYSLHAIPEESDRSFLYLDLGKIQCDYMKMFCDKYKAEKARFLREVRIDPFEADNMRNQLKILGVDKTKMYPELSEIFSEYVRGEK